MASAILKIAIAAFVTSMAMFVLVWMRLTYMDDVERIQFRCMSGRDAVSNYPVLTTMMALCVVALVVSVIAVTISVILWAVGV
jgi:hypothetical protein